MKKLNISGGLVKLLHKVGLTNLSNKQVSQYDSAWDNKELESAGKLYKTVIRNYLGISDCPLNFYISPEEISSFNQNLLKEKDDVVMIGTKPPIYSRKGIIVEYERFTNWLNEFNRNIDKNNSK